MNRGVMGKKLISSLRQKFTADDLKAAKDGLRSQFALEGIVGCIAVDGRGYKNCQAALAAATHSPFKGFIRHVIGCSCGTPHQIPSSDGRMVVAESKSGSVDEFLASGDNEGTKLVSHCQSTMLPILAAKGDLDSSEMDQTLIDVMNVTELPEDAVQTIRESKCGNLQKVQKAFRQLVSIRDRREAEKYSGKVDTAGFVVDTEERPIELVDAPKKEEVAVDLNRETTAELQINSKKDGSKGLPVNEKPAELVADVVAFAAQDVEMETFKEPEFENADEIGLDEELPGPGEVDVDLRQDMQV